MDAFHGAIQTVKNEFHEHVGSQVPQVAQTFHNELHEHVPQVAKMLDIDSARKEQVPYVDVIPTSGSAISENLRNLDAAKANPVKYDANDNTIVEAK